MPLPSLLLPLLGGISSAVQGAGGIAQLIKAKKVKPRKVDQGYVDNVDLSRNLMLADKAPGQSQAETSIRSNAAQSAEAVQESGTGVNNKLAALSSLNKNTNDSLETINSQAQQFRLNNVGRFQNSVNQLADAKQQAENEASATKSALQGAGLQNLFGGIQGAVSNVAQSLPDKYYEGVGGQSQKIAALNSLLQMKGMQTNETSEVLPELFRKKGKVIKK